jgi:hypothetical protein
MPMAALLTAVFGDQKWQILTNSSPLAKILNGVNQWPRGGGGVFVNKKQCRKYY